MTSRYLTAFFLVFSWPFVAFASQPTSSHEGYVIQVLDDYAIVDIGGEQGISVGDEAILVVSDSSPSEQIITKVIEVAETMCRISLEGITLATVQVGDLVQVRTAAQLADQSDESEIKQLRSRFGDSRVSHEPLSNLTAGEPVMVTLVAVGDLLPTEVNLHLRHKGSFKTFPMEPFGDAGWTVTVSGEEIQIPGLEYFIDGTLEDGRPIALFRGDDNPWRVAVKGGSRGKGWTARVGGFFEWQDFYLTKPNHDSYWHASLDFAYRLRKDLQFEIRGGLGALEGIGGEKAAVESGASPNHRLITWLYFEPVLRFGNNLRFFPRVMLGGFLKYVEANPQYWLWKPNKGSAMFGTALHLEVGPEDQFSLRFGGQFLQSIGIEFDAQVTFVPIKGVPMGLFLAASNFPTADEWAARLHLFAGYQALEWLTIEARLGTNIRSTSHAGIGGGLSLSFGW